MANNKHIAPGKLNPGDRKARSIGESMRQKAFSAGPPKCLAPAMKQRDFNATQKHGHVFVGKAMRQGGKS